MPFSACSFPILARRFPRLPIPRRFLFISRHFGTGVLIATAFVHLLPTAFNSLTDPCLPRFWNQGYPAMAGFVSMMSVFLVVTVEMFFATKGAKHVHGKEYDDFIAVIGDSEGDLSNGREAEYVQLAEQNYDHALGKQTQSSNSASPNHTTRSGGTGEECSDELGLQPTSQIDDDGEDGELLAAYSDEETTYLTGNSQRDTSYPTHKKRTNLGNRHSHQQHQQRFSTDVAFQNPHRQLLQCLLLEAGILFHSVFIGMALSVATGTAFIVLLVAISFHQTFEGFALGSRIASLIPALFPPSSTRPWLMALAYGTTTPIGQAIGLIMHNLYDPASEMGLLMVGFTNAISSGLLVFAGLVELLAEDFLSDTSYETLKGRRRVEACVSVLAGAILMALVGAWA
jgi:zinc transporter ZupT